MKKSFYWLSFFLLFGLTNSSLSSSNLAIKEDLEDSKKGNIKINNKDIKFKNFSKLAYLEKKIIKNNIDTKNNFNLPLYLGNFFNELSANLVDQSKSIEELFAVTIDSNNQYITGSNLIAEGDVLIKSNIGIMRASKLSYDQKLKKIIIEGDISFKTDSQFLKAETIQYDFINKKGFILDAFGSINFKSLKNIFENEKSDNLSDNFEEDFTIKSVKLDNSSELQLRKNNASIQTNINPTSRSRFKSDKIEINDNIWTAEELKLTNDPFNEPQLIINNKDFKFFKKNKENKIKTKWSSLTFEDKLTIPIGPRNINLDNENNLRWGLTYDKKKYDGISIYRTFDPLFLGKSKRSKFNFLSKFNIQRLISGKTKSFSHDNQDILGDKVEQDAEILDYFGIDAELTSSIGNWKYNLKAETNSVDFEKLDKILEGKSYLTKNIYLKTDDNYFATGDISFFGTFREKTDNGSLGEILVNNSYGLLYEFESLKNIKNTKVTKNISLGYGQYESPSRFDSKSLITEKRSNLSLQQKNEYVVWKLKNEKYLNEDYKYSPNIINQGLFWLIEGKVDFLRYENENKQDILSIKTGPKLVLGSFKNDFFDYTELGIYPRFKFNRGNSPFSFDQVVDKSVIEFNLKQRLYKALAVKFSGDFNLEKEKNEDYLINPSIEISWNRRAYKVGLFYDLDKEEGGINFSINSFNFNGLGKKFK